MQASILAEYFFRAMTAATPPLGSLKSDYQGGLASAHTSRKVIKLLLQLVLMIIIIIQQQSKVRKRRNKSDPPFQTAICTYAPCIKNVQGVTQIRRIFLETLIDFRMLVLEHPLQNYIQKILTKEVCVCAVNLRMAHFKELFINLS